MVTVKLRPVKISLIAAKNILTSPLLRLIPIAKVFMIDGRRSRTNRLKYTKYLLLGRGHRMEVNGG